MEYAVIRHTPGRDWITEVLPNETEANEWAQTFRDHGKPETTYTVEPLASVLTE